ncbi:polysaccharide deacetylase family protein [Oryzifoliimicrobium ureilyticus]|uniref:polysaccharide deacetylase family protein n=1 Tax=Oryzifoliimicrobium ureilyticus TaxID=3113724 RepID=UPI0030760EB9
MELKQRMRLTAITAGLEISHLAHKLNTFSKARGRGVIFTLHHVRPHIERTFNPNAHLEITPQFLDCLLGRLKSDGYRFIRLQEVPDYLSKADAQNPFAVFTLDDGYKNNKQYATPIFERHECPFTIFIAGGLAERTHSLWWETLSKLLNETSDIQFDFGEGLEKLQATTSAEKTNLFSRFAGFVHAGNEAERVAQLDTFALRCGIEPISLVDDLVMTPLELRQIAEHPLVDFGAHTMSHRAVGRLPPADAFQEMQASADYLESLTRRRPSSIAFPYGTKEAATERDGGLAAQAGFKLAVTTQPGIINDKAAMTYLPRMSINGLYQRPRYVAALASGIPLKLMGR